MRNNIVLTGFMGTGKTTVGKKVAEKLNMKFIDTDSVIEREEGMSISDIFSQKGEKEFRKIESRIVKKVSQNTNCVIATGGGVVLNKTNMDCLRKNGIIIYFESDVESIFRNVNGSRNRPLLQSDDLRIHIYNMLEKRKNYYMNHDYKINVGNLTVEEVVNKVIDIYKNL